MNTVILATGNRQQATGNSHNYGLDLLRIVAMFMIVMIHVLGYGGVRDTPAKLTVNYNIAWLMNTAAYCAVNCYALISGYNGLHARHKVSGIIALWLKAAFYGVAITAAVCVAAPGSVGVREWVKACFPVMFRQYWYFTAYFALFPFMKLLNAGVDSLPRKTLRNSLIGIIFVLSVMQTAFHRDVFGTSGGFSMLWLMVMYILGAYVRKYDALRNVGSLAALSGYAAAVVIAWGAKLAAEYITLRLTGTARGGNVLTLYTSPMMILAALCLLAVFSRLRLSGLALKAVKILAPGTFSVYLIHLQRLLLRHAITGRFTAYASYSPLKMVCAVIITTLAIYILCAAVDFLRAMIFRASGIEALPAKIERMLTKHEGL